MHQGWRKVLTGYSVPACQQPCQRLMAALGASQSTPDAFYLSEESGCPAQSSAGGHLVVGPSFIGRSDALMRVYRNRSKRSCFLLSESGCVRANAAFLCASECTHVIYTSTPSRPYRICGMGDGFKFHRKPPYLDTTERQLSSC